MRLELELAGLRDQRVDEVLRQNFGESANVKDVLLGIEGRQLTAQLRQRVDDLRCCAPHPGIKSGEQSGWTAADDGDIGYFVAHLRTKYIVATLASYSTDFTLRVALRRLLPSHRHCIAP